LELVLACEGRGEDENEKLIDRGVGSATPRENPSTTPMKMTTNITGEFIE
jgi:hypothetical protein